MVNTRGHNHLGTAPRITVEISQLFQLAPPRHMVMQCNSSMGESSDHPTRCLSADGDKMTMMITTPIKCTNDNRVTSFHVPWPKKGGNQGLFGMVKSTHPLAHKLQKWTVSGRLSMGCWSKLLKSASARIVDG